MIPGVVIVRVCMDVRTEREVRSEIWSLTVVYDCVPLEQRTCGDRVVRFGEQYDRGIGLTYPPSNW